MLEMDIALVLGDTSALDNLSIKKANLSESIGRLTDVEFKMRNLLTAMESRADASVLVQRPRDLEGQENNLKKQLLSFQSEVKTMSNIGPDDQVYVDNLAELTHKSVSRDTDLDEKHCIRFSYCPN